MPVLIILIKVSLFVKGSTKLADFNTVRTLAIALNPNANFLKDQQQVRQLILDQFREARENVKQLVTVPDSSYWTSLPTFQIPSQSRTILS
jgi:ubiquinone biosynthesis protein Coq4